MAAFDFPSSPNVNDIYTLNGVAFMWNGSVWKRYSTSTGAQGFQGAAGAVGAQGAQGTNGTIGSDGAQGAQGHQGATGTGATGAQGAAGATGAQGAAGATGAQGTPFDRSEYNYTASGGQTAFAAAYANASDVDVFMNGVRLTPAEFTPSGGTTITLASGATAGDIIDILTFASAGPTGAQGAQGHQGDAFNRSESNFTATSGQTSFAPSGGYTNGDDLDVFVNGVRLTPADYTATNGTNVVLDVGANTGDIVDIIYYEAAGPAGAQGAAGAAGIAGTITFSTSAPSNPITGDLWYDTDDGAFAGYYNDGNTSQWIDLSGGPRGAQGATGSSGAQGATGSIPSNITAVSGTFSGNVSIGGTLTYEDVTNIDSVGVITARSGIHITGTDEELRIYRDQGDRFGGLRYTGSLFKLRLPAADHFTVDDSSNNERFRITSAGNIGINDTAPSQKLNVGGNIMLEGSDQYLYLTNVGTGNAGMYIRGRDATSELRSHSTGMFTWEVTGGEKMRLTSDGYLGINETSPDRRLHINSGATDTALKLESTDAEVSLELADNTGSSYIGGGGNYLNFYSGGNERIRITSTGRMGVGTNDPNALLEVRDSENTTQGNSQIRISKGVGGGAAPASTSRANTYLHLGGTEWGSGGNGQYLIGFGYTADEIGTGIPAYIGFKETTVAGYTQGDLIFGTRGNTTGTNNPSERLRIDSGGNATFKYKVSIGDSYGGGEIFRLGKTSGTSYMAFHNGGANMGFIGFADQLIGGGASNELGIRSQDEIRFATGGNTERFRISNETITCATGVGMAIDGGTSQQPTDSSLLVTKQNNNDWALQVRNYEGTSTDYGFYSRSKNTADYAIGVYDHDNSSWRFRVNGGGTIYATNTTVSSISDQRLKENIIDANSQWDDIKALRFRNFNWREDSGFSDGRTYLGLIAQEVEPISPNLVDINAQSKEDIENEVPDPEYKNVKYSIVWMKAVKALQEAQTRIETLETQLTDALARITALEG